MIIHNRMLGAALIIAGTSIGAGLLALPVATSAYGLWPILAILVASWFVMTITAFLFLEISLWLPEGSNLVSMAKATLGIPGQFAAWIIYLLLFYLILAAYSMALGGLFSGSVENFFSISISPWILSLVFIALIGILLYDGVQYIDGFNRILMLGLVVVFLTIGAFLVPHVNTETLTVSHSNYLLLALPFVVFSFGYHNVIPGLRTYLHSNVGKIWWAIVSGSLLILSIYGIWIFLVMGVVPFDGPTGFLQIQQASGDDAANLARALQQNVGITWISNAFQYFTVFAIATSFVGIAYALFDFLADGLNIKKTRGGRILIALLVLIPPFIIGLLFPGFMRLLAHAGILVTILLILFPALMVWRGRTLFQGDYQVAGGKLTLVFVILASALVMYTLFI